MAHPRFGGEERETGALPLLGFEVEVCGVLWGHLFLANLKHKVRS